MTTFFSPVRIALLVVLCVTTIAGFSLIPGDAMLPIHWNLVGEPDSFAPRNVALLMPVGVVLAMWLVFEVARRFAPPAQLEAGRNISEVAFTSVTGIAVVISIVTLLIGIGQAVDIVRIIAIAFGALLLVLGNALPKSQPNSFAGIRIPSTLGDSANWRSTHMVAGVLSMISGALLLMLSIFVPSAHLLPYALGCLLTPMVIAVGYSLMRARR